MTRAAKALARASRGYWEAVAIRDPLAIELAQAEHHSAHIRVERQEGR